MTDDEDNEVNDKGKMMNINNKEEDKHQIDDEKVEYNWENNGKNDDTDSDDVNRNGNDDGKEREMVDNLKSVSKVLSPRL